MSDDELREALERYSDVYMSLLEIDKMLVSEHVFSKRFEKKMKRLLWSQRHFGKHIRVGYAVRKIAIAAGISLSLLVANEVSARVWGFGAWEIIRSLVDGGRGMRLEFHKSKEEGKEKELPKAKYDMPQYVPKGYQQDSFEEDEYSFGVSWHKNDNQLIRYDRDLLLEGEPIVVDAENDEVRKVTVIGFSVEVYYDGETVGISWLDDKYMYTIDSFDIEEDELMKMMKSNYE